MDRLNIGQEAKVLIKWRVLPIDRTDEAEENIAAKFAKKYGIPRKNISVEPVFINTKGEEGEIEYGNEITASIQEPAFFQRLCKEYIAARGIENCDFDEIIKIDDQINSNINFEVYEKHKKYSIKWIKWSNFMSYGPDNYFDFTGLKGLVLLTSEPANQGGKSTFCLDLLRFLLFGKVTSRESDWTLAKVFNKHIPDATEVSVEGCICIDGTDYVIKRVVTRPAKRTEKSKVSQKITYYRVDGENYMELADEDNLDNEAGTTTTNTNKLIKEAIGNERDFDLMICVDSDNLKGLISLKDADRGRLITRWIGLLPLEDKDKIARERFNKVIQPSLYSNRYNKVEVEHLISECEENNKEIKKNGTAAKKAKEEAEKRLEGHRKTRDMLLESKQTIDKELINADVTTIKAEQERIKEDGAKKRAEKNATAEKLDGLKDVAVFDEANYKKKIAEDKDLTVRLNNARQNFTRVKNDIEALKKGEFCPTCGARLKNVDNTEAISKKQEELLKLTKEGQTLSKELETISKEIENLEAQREQYNVKVRLELLADKIDVDIENLLARYRENERILKDIKSNEEAIRKNNEIDANINIVNENIKVEQGIVSQKETEIANYVSEIKANDKTISDSKKIVEILAKEEEIVRNWKIYLEMVGKNGISKMVLRNALPLINGELKHLLNGVCDFTVEVAIDDHNDVAFYLIHDGVVSNLASGSGFEQTVSSLALRSVLSKISSFSKPSFVVFDEILGGVADENYDQVKLLYDKIVSDYAFIIQISHLKAISDWHNKTITVKKINNVSKIETN